MGDSAPLRRGRTFTFMRRVREGWMSNPPFWLILAAVVVSVSALPNGIPTEDTIQPMTELPTADNFQVPLNRQGANVFVDDSHGFDEIFEDAAKQSQKQVDEDVSQSPTEQGKDGGDEFMSETEVLDDKAGAKAFMDAFAKLDRAAKSVDRANKQPDHVAKHVDTKDPHAVVQERPAKLLQSRNKQNGKEAKPTFSPGPPPSYPISDYSANTAARLATDAITADTTNSAFEHYKKNPFALKVTGKGSKAILALQNPAAFTKQLSKIPKNTAKDPQHRAKWAKSADGRTMKCFYDHAMTFWNVKGHEVYGKACSTNGSPCAASSKLPTTYTFAKVSQVPVPVEVINAWVSDTKHPDPKSCLAAHKTAAHAPKIHGSVARAVCPASLTLLSMALVSVWWVREG